MAPSRSAVVGGRQDDQHAALIIVICREDVRDGLRRQVLLRVHLDLEAPGPLRLV